MATKAYDIKDSGKISDLLRATKGEKISAKKAQKPASPFDSALDNARSGVSSAINSFIAGQSQKPAASSAVPPGLADSVRSAAGKAASSIASSPLTKGTSQLGKVASPASSPQPAAYAGGDPPWYSMSEPGIGETTISQYLPGFFQPTNAQGYVDAGSFNTPTASEGFYAQNAGQFAAPGAAEQWWAKNAGQFNTPGAAEDFYNEHKGDLANLPDPTNRAEEAYQASKGRRPDIAKDPGLEPYYDEAISRGSRTLNKRAAAMGNYGSSVALGEVGNLVSGLEAEMANRKADYDLRRIAEERAWEQLGGEMASSADRSSLGISQNELSQLLGMGTLAQASQQGGLSRLLGAAGASQGAQGAQTSRLSAGSSAASAASQGQLGRDQLGLSAALGADANNRANLTAGTTAAALGQQLREGRVGGAYDRTLGLANVLSSAIGQSGQAGQAADQEIFAASQVYGPAAASSAANYADQQAARGTQMWSAALQFALVAGMDK